MERKTSPYISIVVCIYNGEKTLQLTIDSLIDQHYPKDKYEIIFINDGSTDKSSHICLDTLKKRVNKYPRIIYAHQKNGGLSIARNTGIRMAIGKVIAYIDQDAAATPTWVFDIAKEFKKSILPQIIGGPVLLLNKNSKFASLLYDSFFSHFMKSQKSIIGTNMAFSRSLLEKTPFHHMFDRRGDETYIFEKLKPDASPMQISGAAVYHETPESLNAWLKTRFESGYFSAQIDLIDAKYIDASKMFIYRLLFLILPIMIIILLIMKLNVLLYLGIVSYILISIRRYLANGTLKNLIKHFWNTRKAKSLTKLRIVPVICFLTFLGNLYNDFGYIYKIAYSFTTKDNARFKMHKEPEIIQKESNILL